MEYVNVNGFKVPAIGLGTWQSKDNTCVKAVKTALNSGYEHVDTAQIYGNEAQVGEGIRRAEVNRDDIWLTTKVWRDNLNEQNLKNSVEESLKKLQTDYVDLLLIHWPFAEMNTEVALNQMADLVDEGKTRAIGISNFNVKQTENAVNLSKKAIITNQVEYHPFLNQDKVLSACRGHNMFLTAYSPLARGDVLGNPTLKRIGENHGKNEAQIALKWLIQQEEVVAIPKASSKKHINQNKDVFDFKLSTEEIEEIMGLTEKMDRKVDPDFGPRWD